MKIVSLKVGLEEAKKTILSQRKGLIKKEKLEGVKLLWIPVAIIKLRVIEKDKFEFVGPKIVEIMNVYELVDGLWTGLSFSYPPKIEEVESLDEGKVEKNVDVEKLVRFLEELNVFKNHLKFAAFGISANASELKVLDVIEVYYPFYIGKLVGKTDRYVIVSGVSGNLAGMRTETLKNLYEC